MDGLDTTYLQVAFQYSDAQTDYIALLTRAMICAAQQMGALLKMPATLTGARLDQNGERDSVI